MTTLVLQPDGTNGIDSYVNNANPTTNYGTSTDLQWGQPTTNVCRSYIKFDLSSIPPASTIISATLELNRWAWTGGGAGEPYDRVYRVTSSWDEGAITWNVQPSWSTDTIMGTIPYVAAPGTATITLDTTQFSLMVATNYGMMLRGREDATSTGELANSSDDSVSSVRPKLTIDYIPAGGSQVVMII